MNHSEDSDSAKMANSDAPLPIYRRPKDDQNEDTTSTLNLSGDTVPKDHPSVKDSKANQVETLYHFL